jgi:phosphate transport system permease protein
MAPPSAAPSTAPPTSPDERAPIVIHRRRRVTNYVWWGVCALAMLLVLVPVVWIIAGVVSNAVSGWSWSVLTNQTTGVGGGLSNAITGTLVLITGTGILAGLVGIGSGIYIAEICPRRWAPILRGASEILSGIPSIVFGYVGYVALVIYFDWGYSTGAALVVISLLVVPYVAKSTELALSQVPTTYREGTDALGMTRAHGLRRVLLRSAMPGISTGIIIALAVSLGETAPLLYTAGFTNAMPSLGLTHNPIAYLTYAVWSFYDEPVGNVEPLAHDAALILVVMVLVLILLSRTIVYMSQRHSPEAVSRGRMRGGPRSPAHRRSETSLERSAHKPPAKH